MLGGNGDSQLTHLVKLESADRGFSDVLTAVLSRFFSVAKAERHDVFITHERFESVDVSQHGGTSAGDDRQIHRGNFAIRLCFRLIEVGVTVNEEQPVPPGTSEREHDADDVATVAAKHKREFILLQHVGDRSGKLQG